MNLTAFGKTGLGGCIISNVSRRRLLTKTLLVMKLTTILMLVACLQVSAGGLSQKISLSVKNASLEKVLSEIEKQSGYSFWYRTELLKNADKITIDLRDANLDEALKKCFEKQSFDYVIIDHTIVIKLRDEQVYYDPPPPPAVIQVKGKVSTADGAPLSGVSVIIKNTNIKIT